MDEADRILDLGFEKDITVILNAVNAECQKRQNVLLSATLTEGVTRLVDISLHNPVSISVLDKNCNQPNPKEVASIQLNSFAIPESLDQHVVLVPSKLRLVCLAAFILQKCKFEKNQKMIVFFSSCELVEFHYSLFLHTLLCHSGTPTSEHLPSASWPLKFLRLHGNMEQEERTSVFHEFSHSETGVLLCTDVASRGLDLPQVTWIVQSTFTASEELPGLAVMGAACSFWLLRRQNMSTRWLLTKSMLVRLRWKIFWLSWQRMIVLKGDKGEPRNPVPVAPRKSENEPQYCRQCLKIMCTPVRGWSPGLRKPCSPSSEPMPPTPRS